MSNVQEGLNQNDCTDPVSDAGKPSVSPSPPNPQEFSWRTNPQKDEGTKKPSRRKWEKDQKEDDDISADSGQGDICRICHMGGFPPVTDTQPIWEWQTHNVHRVSSQISTLSSYTYLGPLISACKCRGSVALVHAECLERWLTESGHTRCELCGHKYATKRIPRHGIFTSIGIWFKTVVATQQMMLDIMYLLVTTPLALFSCYICSLALRVVLESGFLEVPWMIIAMLPTCSLTLIAYWGWLITLGRIHSRRWRRFWRNNFVVRLLPDNALNTRNPVNNFTPARSPLSIIVNLVDDPYQRIGIDNSFPVAANRQNDEAEEFLRIM